jgi:hypothetical protein
VKSLGEQAAWLFLLAIPVACVAWTVTHEEIFREPREKCVARSKNCRGIVQRKFFYVFTCEYCFSHYVALGFLAITGFHLLLDGWRGVLLAWFGVVWIANIYMGVFGRLRLDIKSQRLDIAKDEKEIEELEKAGR